MNPPVLGYRNPYPSHYDLIPFPKGYQKPNFEKFDGINESPHSHLARFYLACGETALNDALLIRQFVQSQKGAPLLGTPSYNLSQYTLGVTFKGHYWLNSWWPTWREVALQSSVTTPIQDRDQPEEKQEFDGPAFYDLGTLFYELEVSAFIPQGQISHEHQVDNMSALVTSTPSLEEQMQELQSKLEENKAEIANLIFALKTESEKKIMRLTVATQLSLSKISGGL